MKKQQVKDKVVIKEMINIIELFHKIIFPIKVQILIVI